MNKQKNIALIALVALLLGACKEALKDGELPQTTDKLIVICGIAPNEPIEVILDVAQPMLGKPAPDDNYNYSDPDTTRYMRHAQVMLTDVNSGQQVQLMFDTTCQASKQTFILPQGEQFDIVPGHEYRLNVEYRDCPPVSATTTVPAGDFSIENVVLMPHNESNRAYAYVEVRNNTNEPASYSLTCGGTEKSVTYNIDNRLRDSLGQLIIIVDTSIYKNVDTSYRHYYYGECPNCTLVDIDTIVTITSIDTIYHYNYIHGPGYWVSEIRSCTYPNYVDRIFIQAQPGGNASGTLEMYLYKSHGGVEFSTTFYSDLVTSIHVNVKHLNNDYVRYHSAWNTDDIFMLFSKPPAGYSNIDNGLGIFCAWMTKTFEITDFQSY